MARSISQQCDIPISVSDKSLLLCWNVCRCLCCSNLKMLFVSWCLSHGALLEKQLFLHTWMKTVYLWPISFQFFWLGITISLTISRKNTTEGRSWSCNPESKSQDSVWLWSLHVLCQHNWSYNIQDRCFYFLVFLPSSSTFFFYPSSLPPFFSHCI